MHRSRLLVGSSSSASRRARSRSRSCSRTEPVISPYADEPGPAVQQQLPPVPPPVVAPPPPPGYQYQYQYQQPQAPYYYQPRQPITFHEEMQPRYGLMVAGLVIFGASWSINAASAYLADEWQSRRAGHRPVHGVHADQHFVGLYAVGNRMLVGLLVFDGLIETAGAIMLIAGAITHHKVRVYDRDRACLKCQSSRRRSRPA